MTRRTSLHEAYGGESIGKVRGVEGALIADKYRIDRMIGRGGVGDVFSAEHLGLRARVAVKFLRLIGDGIDDRRIQRFYREAQVAVRLSTLHAVRVFDVGTIADGTPFLVMELLEGETLLDYLCWAGPLPAGEAVYWTLQAIAGVSELHALGVVHRDLKPNNMFLANSPGTLPILKLLDFGMVTKDPARSDEPRLTASATALGTPLYMGPEHLLSSNHVDARADVWSLGVTLYQLLAGRVPFYGKSAAAVAASVLHEDPPPLDRVKPSVPSALAAVVHRCLEKDPNRRFDSVLAMAAALRNVVEPEPPGPRSQEDRLAVTGPGESQRTTKKEGALDSSSVRPVMVAPVAKRDARGWRRRLSRATAWAGVALALGAGAAVLSGQGAAPTTTTGAEAKAPATSAPRSSPAPDVSGGPVASPDVFPRVYEGSRPAPSDLPPARAPTPRVSSSPARAHSPTPPKKTSAARDAVAVPARAPSIPSDEDAIE